MQGKTNDPRCEPTIMIQAISIAQLPLEPVFRSRWHKSEDQQGQSAAEVAYDSVDKDGLRALILHSSGTHACKFGREMRHEHC